MLHLRLVIQKILVFVNSIGPLLLCLSTELPVRCRAATLRVCLLYQKIKITETNSFTITRPYEPQKYVGI